MLCFRFCQRENQVGGLVGFAKGCVIKDCYADVEVKGGHSVGGLIGSLDGNESFSIENCYTVGSILTNGGGGLIGSAWLRGDRNGVINNCVSTSGVTSSAKMELLEV